MYTYKILDITKVVDGDTVYVLIDLGFRLYKELKVRLKGYDAPEIYGPEAKDDKEYENGIKAKEKLEELIKEASIIKTYKDPGIYGRYSGELFTEDGRSINDLMKQFLLENNLLKEE